ncbi:hypothetical protein FMUND_14693 [Fusarium mundagurra]|uniref:Uncharacterized protein n=1 Tax=Fusarium mundagurra TaxID=1567541 RepID=A0A8H5XTG4_9HYPO|nr:hypothetical protein FMUND_14693 [Fusarium mundagurra]
MPLQRFQDLIDAKPCCALDDRILHLDGFNADIIMEQCQCQHQDLLVSQAGPQHPILALPYLSQQRGVGSMLLLCGSITSKLVVLRFGHLMSSLLMAAISKLAAMRTTAPVVLDEAEDTVTRLMRGLFGNLMTIAGSGVRPWNFVWQLFRLNPQYDVPVTDADWVWYENVVKLYPYTGWPLKQFHENLLKLLNKIIVRVITKNENVAEIKENRVLEKLRFCKLRNIQLEHYRTIITIFELQENIPSELEKQTKGFTRMMQYINHLAKGGARRPANDLVYGNVYTKRSAAFKDLKIAVALASVLDLHKEIALKWQIKSKQLKVQNLHYYRDLIDADVSDDANQETKNRTKKIVGRIIDDAEKRRIPWQVSNYAAKDNVEPLDEQFFDEVLTGKCPEAEIKAVVEVVKEELVEEGGFAAFKTTMAPKFIFTMEKALSAEDVCKMTKVPGSSMRVFIRALNPEFEWDDLGQQFKIVILSLLRDRSERMDSRPAARMLRVVRWEM